MIKMITKIWETFQSIDDLWYAGNLETKELICLSTYKEDLKLLDEYEIEDLESPIFYHSKDKEPITLILEEHKKLEFSPLDLYECPDCIDLKQEIESLKQQIEAMKIPGNCKHVLIPIHSFENCRCKIHQECKGVNCGNWTLKSKISEPEPVKEEVDLTKYRLIESGAGDYYVPIDAEVYCTCPACGEYLWSKDQVMKHDCCKGM